MKYLPEDLSPYSALLIRAFLPTFSKPKSFPQMMKYFYDEAYFRSEFLISAAHISRSFRVAYVKAILILSLETTPAYMDPIGVEVLWLSNTHLALLVKSISRQKLGEL